MSRMQFQYDYMGGSSPQNLGLIVCGMCLDDLAFQQKLLILPPDPQPIFNTRPENYVVDETSWLTTQDDSIISAQDGELFITSIPNPSDAANTSVLASTIRYPSGSVSTVYLDLFDGNPATNGRSVLSAITGSAVRTNIASQLTTVSGIAENTSPIVVSSSSASTTNISYAAVYSASSGGTLLASGSLSASPTIAKGNPVQFASLGLQINLN
jgi:hypothetical protein